MRTFNVLIWDFNSDMLEEYDVLPYFRDEYDKAVKYCKTHKPNDYWKVPKDLAELKAFIKDRSRYRFCSRCEYEIIASGNNQGKVYSRDLEGVHSTDDITKRPHVVLHSWPPRKDGNEYKLDIHEQVMMNINIITEILYEELLNTKK